jgi:hypothetical protein
VAPKTEGWMGHLFSLISILEKNQPAFIIPAIFTLMRGAIFQKFTYIVALCLAGTSVFGAEPSPNAAQLVSVMGDYRLTQDERNAAAGSLLKLGKEAMPALINSLHDNRIYFPNYVTPSAANGPSFNVDLTVGLECDYILTDIVSNSASTKAFGFRYKIFNWPDWWRKHQNMTQGDFQKEASRFNLFIIESTGKGDSIPHINQP